MDTNTGQMLSGEQLRKLFEDKPEKAKKGNWVEVPTEWEAKLKTMNRAERRKWYQENKMAWKPLKGWS